jgi:UDP-N-acetylglucosamine acyltransferase
MNYIHPTAVLGPNVVLGDDVYVGPLCVIGYPPEFRGKEAEGKGVVIKKGARLTGLVTVDSGVDAPTVIGADCYLMKHSHIGHDVWLFESVTISCGAKIGGHSIINRFANIGLNAVIHQRQDIKEGVMIGMGSVVTKKLITEPYKTYAGNPAKLIGDNNKHPRYPEYTVNLRDYPE